MGFHTELTIPEAVNFYHKRIDYLSKDVLVHRQSKAKLIALYMEAALMLVKELRNEVTHNDLSL